MRDALKHGFQIALTNDTQLAGEGERTAERHALAELRAAGDAVTSIGATFGLPAGQLAAAEALDRLEIDTSVPADVLGLLSESVLSSWFTALAPDLRLDLRVSALDDDASPSPVSLRGRESAADLVEELCRNADEAAAQGDEVVIEVRISIGKSRARAAATALVRARDEDDTRAGLSALSVAVFFRTAALVRLFSVRAVPEWERLGLVRSDGPWLLALCDAAGYLAGPALEIIGARISDAVHWLPKSRSTWHQFVERTAEMRDLHMRESLWPSAPTLLTPEHLRIQSRQSGLEDVAVRVERMRAQLAASYLASTVQRGSDGKLVLRFAGARPCTCQLETSDQLEAPVSESSGSIARLTAWAYQHASPDKLAIAREFLAVELPAGGDATLADLDRASGLALEAAKANFVLYLRHNSAEYFQRRQQALDAVSANAETVRKAVAELTGELVDAVYRMVGLLLGVVIAGLIQPAASLDVQRLACALVAVYVLFVLLFVLPARRQRYDLESAELDSRLAAMSELSVAERAKLRALTTPANTLFERYFRRSWAIYAVLATACCLYLILLFTPLGPHIMLPHPSATPTVTQR